MIKEELVEEIAGRTGFSKKDCMIFLDVFCDTVADSIGQGEQVKIVNFGVFKVKEGKARTGKNFASNTSYPIPPRNNVVFIPGNRLKSAAGGADLGDCN